MLTATTAQLSCVIYNLAINLPEPLVTVMAFFPERETQPQWRNETPWLPQYLYTLSHFYSTETTRKHKLNIHKRSVCSHTIYRGVSRCVELLSVYQKPSPLRHTVYSLREHISMCNLKISAENYMLFISDLLTLYKSPEKHFTVLISFINTDNYLPGIVKLMCGSHPFPSSPWLSVALMRF